MITTRRRRYATMEGDRNRDRAGYGYSRQSQGRYQQDDEDYDDEDYDEEDFDDEDDDNEVRGRSRTYGSQEEDYDEDYDEEDDKDYNDEQGRGGQLQECEKSKRRI